MGIQVFPAPSTSVPSGAQNFTSSSTWTAPAGVTKVNYVMAGGGGGGGSGNNNNNNSGSNFGGGGGAGGEVARGSLAVTPGTSYSIIVGAGGAGGTASNELVLTSAAAGGYSGVGLNLTVQNAVINGAMEFGGGNDSWLGGRSSSTGFPLYDSSYPSGYSDRPGLSQVSYNNQRTGGTVIPNVSDSNNLKRYTVMQSGNTAYHDIQKFINVTPNTSYVLSGWVSVQSNGSSSQCAIAIDYFTSPNAVGRISGDQTSFTSINSSSTVWTRMSLNTTSPAGANFAVIRFGNNNNSSSSYMGWTGIQLEGGSTLTDYVGMNTPSFKTIGGLGVISVNSGAIAAGGGGGNSSQGGNQVTGQGFGGGRESNASGTFRGCAGNGSGAGTLVSNVPNIIATSTTLPFITGLNTMSNSVSGIPNGGPSWTTTSAGIFTQANGTTASPEGLGAGGMGINAGDVRIGTPGIGAGFAAGSAATGISGSQNTGAGGGGGQNTTNANTPSFSNGGDGGSGAVMLNW